MRVRIRVLVVCLAAAAITWLAVDAFFHSQHLWIRSLGLVATVFYGLIALFTLDTLASDLLSTNHQPSLNWRSRPASDVVVWIPGVGGSAMHTIDQFFWMLNGRTRILTVDYSRRGFDMGQTVEAILAKLRRAGGLERVLVVGQSMGAAIAVELFRQVDKDAALGPWAGPEPSDRVQFGFVSISGVADGRDIKLPVKLARYVHGFLAGLIYLALQALQVYRGKKSPVDDWVDRELLKLHQHHRAWFPGRPMLMKAAALADMQPVQPGEFPHIRVWGSYMAYSDVMLREPSAHFNLEAGFPNSHWTSILRGLHGDYVELPSLYRPVLQQAVAEFFAPLPAQAES